MATYRPIAPADASLRAFTAHASYAGVSIAQPPGYRGSLASAIIATHRAEQRALRLDDVRRSATFAVRARTAAPSQPRQHFGASDAMIAERDGRACAYR